MIFPLSSFGYTVGFLIVVLGRQQLFTENTLTAILPLLRRRNVRTFRLVLQLWLVVLIANLLGALIFAWYVSGELRAFCPYYRRVGGGVLHGDKWNNLLGRIFWGLYASCLNRQHSRWSIASCFTKLRSGCSYSQAEFVRRLKKDNNDTGMTY